MEQILAFFTFIFVNFRPFFDCPLNYEALFTNKKVTALKIHNNKIMVKSSY